MRQEDLRFGSEGLRVTIPSKDRLSCCRPVGQVSRKRAHRRSPAGQDHQEGPGEAGFDPSVFSGPLVRLGLAN